MYALLTEAHVFILYESPFWSGAFLIFIFAVSVWNGGGFYIEVFGRKCVSSLSLLVPLITTVLIGPAGSSASSRRCAKSSQRRRRAQARPRRQAGRAPPRRCPARIAMMSSLPLQIRPFSCRKSLILFFQYLPRAWVLVLTAKLRKTSDVHPLFFPVHRPMLPSPTPFYAFYDDDDTTVPCNFSLLCFFP